MILKSKCEHKNNDVDMTIYMQMQWNFSLSTNHAVFGGTGGASVLYFSIIGIWEILINTESQIPITGVFFLASFSSDHLHQTLRFIKKMFESKELF